MEWALNISQNKQLFEIHIKDSLLKHARVSTHASNGSSTSRKKSVCASHERHHTPSPSQWLTSGKITTYKIGGISCLLGIVASFPILTHLHTHARTLTQTHNTPILGWLCVNVSLALKNQCLVSLWSWILITDCNCFLPFQNH